MGDINKTWEALLSEGIKYQQEFYELLPDWTVYQCRDAAYLKHNISFALYGCPRDLQENDMLPSNKTEFVNFISKNIYENAEFTKSIQYHPEAESKIGILFKQIYKHGINNDGTIYCGIIYNIIFCTKNEITKCPKDAINEQLQAIPIFKIKKYIDKNNFTIKYIDENGRLYKNWEDYKNNNKLPECTMLIPMDGIYQADPNFPITEIKSVVWVEALDSPACSVVSQVVKGIDIVSTVGTVASLGLAIGSVVTPIAPVAVTAGVITGGVSSLWSFGKAAQELVDRKLHAESVSLTDKNALPAWLNIAGCTAEAITAGGSTLLGKAAVAGHNIGKTARVTYNTLVIGKLSINLIGMGFQGYCIFDTYKKDNVINPTHILFFASNALFFGNSVISTKFAHDVITSSQNNVLKDYEATLRNKRHRKAYNRIKRQVTANNSNTISQQAEIIRYIKKVQSRAELFSQPKTTDITTASNTNTKNSNTKNVADFSHNLSTTNVKTGVLLISHGIRLLDPVITFASFVHSSEVIKLLKSSSNVSKLDILSKIIKDLLTNLYCSNDCPQTKLPLISDFEKFLSELEYTNNAEEILVKLFNTVVKFMKSSPEVKENFLAAFDFIWTYVKMTLWDVKDSVIDLCVPELLKNIICKLYDVICSISPYLFEAFKVYYLEKLRFETL